MDEADYVRRRGIPEFQTVLGNIQRLTRRRDGPIVHVQAVLDASNWRDLERLHAFYRDQGVDMVFQLIYDRPFDIEAEEWARMLRRLRPRSPALGWMLRRFLAQWPAIASGHHRAPCLALTTHILVSSDGHLLRCNFQRESVADLRECSLREIWPRLTEQRRQVSGPGRGCTCANTCFTIPAILLS
jgi:sulfatase maturation enzyme AslB (radical SAM superfamily)